MRPVLKSITSLLGGDPIRREIERHADVVEAINLLEPEMQRLSRGELQAKTDEFRGRLRGGESLDDLLVEAFAVVREVAVRTLGLRHYDVQLIGGVVLHQGKIAEMKTGEGKTLVATMPIFLNALMGNGVHLVTVNDYLARRDARWMGPIFAFLGLSVGVLQEAARTEAGRKAFLYNPDKTSAQEDLHLLEIVDRKQAYAADVTYGTNNEFGFDYLRDNMARSLEARSQRGHHYAILDEVDNILIDEARTPLIISGPAQDDPELYERMARVVKQLRPEDYEINERDRTISLTAIGEDHVEQLLGVPLRDPDRPEDITPEQARLLGHLEQGMRAEHLFRRNKDYVLQGGKVVIVDEFTGRLMAGRRWSDGLHQAVEAKEGVKVRQENVTYATITLQNHFRMYDKLAGMTGTAVTEAEEFNKIYGVDVTALPTNLEYVAMMPETDLEPVEYRENGSKFIYYSRTGDTQTEPIFWKRKDHPDVVYRTEEAKLRAIASEILERHVRGQPLLVGTTSVEMSERLSNRLGADMLKTLALAHVLRQAYLEAHEIPDDGMRVDEIEPLYAPLEELKRKDLRAFARELDLPLNAVRPENLERLLRILELSPDLGDRLESILESGIKHNVLNAKKHDEESRIIADAGALGAVTIATNMAGRGVDIKLGGEVAEEVLGAINRVLRRKGIDEPENLNMEERLEEIARADDEAVGIYDAEIKLFEKFMEEGKRVKEVGGLHVLGSERHESRRIDNQLRGRAARQGDPGSSQFFLSMGDELMRLFGGSQVGALMQRLNIDDAVPIAHSIVDRTIEQAQNRVEGAHFDTRKHLLEYDDVLNQQREVFYGQRNRVFSKDDLLEDVQGMLETEVGRHVQAGLVDPEGPWKLLAWLEETQPTLDLEGEHPYPSFMLRVLLDELDHGKDPDRLRDQLLQIASQSLVSQYEHLAKSIEEQLGLALERLDSQVDQRVEMAEMAVEGMMLQAQESGVPVRARQLMQAVEEAAGMKIQVDGAGEDDIATDPETFLGHIPELIEASLGMRIWAGLVQAVENRIGDSLELENRVSIPIDWEAASDMLQEALQRTWQVRANRLLEEIDRDLESTLGRIEQVDKAMTLRALVQMSYGQRLIFDRKTHQKRSAVVARLTYAFTAAGLIDQSDPEELTARVLDHLEGAQENLYRILGEGAVRRQAGATLYDLEEEHRGSLVRAVGQDHFEELGEQGPIDSMPPTQREEVIQLVGQKILTDAYRQLILSVGDQFWVDYLTQMEALRTSIGLEAYGQRDPLVQYKSRAFDMFQQLLDSIRAGVVYRLFRIQPIAQAGASSAPTARAAGAAAVQQVTSGASKRRGRRRRKR
jgi:preprotein translocase subunit SecA